MPKTMQIKKSESNMILVEVLKVAHTHINLLKIHKSPENQKGDDLNYPHVKDPENATMSQFTSSQWETCW